MKKLIAIYIILYALVVCGVIVMMPKGEHTVSKEVVINTSAFQKGDLVVMTKYGLKKAMAKDCVPDTVGIVTVVGEEGRVILKYKR